MPSSFLDLLAAARPRLRPPVLIALGGPRLVADLVTTLGLPDTVCYQMDLHQANRLRQHLQEINHPAMVETLPDVWDLPARFNTAILPVAAHGSGSSR